MIRLLAVATVILFGLVGYAAWREHATHHGFNIKVNRLVEEKDVPALVGLYTEDPLALSGNDLALGLVARALLFYGNRDGYVALRKRYQEKEVMAPAIWQVVDAEELVQDHKLAAAIDKLMAVEFEGEKDQARVAKLAQLGVYPDLGTVWDQLAQFSDTGDVHAAKGAILERLGQVQAARVEYVTAVQKEPKNPLLRNELAEFYRRNEMYMAAADVWAEGVRQNPTVAPFWLKTLFWQTVAAPPTRLPDVPPATPDRALLVMLQTKQQFWDKQLTASGQEGWWLQVLQAIDSGDETALATLLSRRHLIANLWAPRLADAFNEVLRFHQTGSLPSEGSLLVKGERGSKLVTLLQGKEGYAAAALAAGWFEAALRLHELEVLPDDTPSWVAYGITEALRQNRSVNEALEFALKQKETPELALLIGELLMAKGDIDNGVARLVPLLGTRMGDRSCWLLALHEIDQGRLDEAVAYITRDDEFAQSVVGVELRARISLLQGDVTAAKQLYQSVANESVEGKYFLAQWAQKAHDINTVRRLTEQLHQVFPEFADFVAP